MFDVIVVGARCAGSPTAMLLARKGYHVLLLDKASFPSDIMSTHFIHPPGVARLKRWGVIDKVAGSNCPPIQKYSIDFGPVKLTGAPTPYQGVDTAYGPRRRVLDKVLVDAAVAAGAELRENFTLEELCFDGERVTGIRGRQRGGSLVAEKARVVVGADGLHSAVSRMVGAPITYEKPSVACGYYTYWSGVPIEGPELYPRPNRFIVAFPTNDGLTCNLVAWPREEFNTVRKDIEGHFIKSLELTGLVERISHGKREEHFVGAAELPNFFRRAWGPGWALVGDAGYHKDPVGAHGISDAFRDAELLADAIDAGLSAQRTVDDALAEYERCRNEIAMPLFELNFQFATLQPPPPEMQALLGALQGNQPQIDRFFGVISGSVPVPEFFSPDNMQGILQSAAAPRAD